MKPHERKLALEAVLTTFVAIHGTEPLSSAELATWSDRQIKYALADLGEGVRGMNAAEIRHLSLELKARGVDLAGLVMEMVSTISSIGRKKTWSESDLILLSAAREMLPPDQLERLRLELPE